MLAGHARPVEELEVVLESFLSGMNPQLLGPAGGLPEPEKDELVIEPEPEPAQDIEIVWPQEVREHKGDGERS